MKNEFSVTAARKSPPPAPPETFSINIEGLSREQAQSLHDLCGNIGGDSKNSARGVTDGILDALRSVGVKKLPDGRYKVRGIARMAEFGETFDHYDCS